jgi:catechol 2,3-dioxygenase-like lactoylglutathione lyase family enzyme
MTLKADVILAGVAVADIEAAIGWYGKLLGRTHDERPMQEAAEWRLASGGSIQLILDKERAGKSMTTIAVRDIEQLVTDLDARGVTTKASPPGSGMYRLAQVRDPDGNLLTFAQKQT